MKTITPKEIIEFIDSRLKGDVIPLDVERDAIHLIEEYASQFQPQDIQPPKELETLLNEKYPILSETQWEKRCDSVIQPYYEYMGDITEQRRIATEFYLSGQSSLKKGQPSDEEIKQAALKSANEKFPEAAKAFRTSNHFDGFLDGGKYVRDTYATPYGQCDNKGEVKTAEVKKIEQIIYDEIVTKEGRVDFNHQGKQLIENAILAYHNQFATPSPKVEGNEVDWSKIKEDFYSEYGDDIDRPGAVIMLTTKNLTDIVEWFHEHAEFSPQGEAIKFAEWINLMDIYQTNERGWVKNNPAFREKNFAENTAKLYVMFCNSTKKSPLSQ